MSSFVTVVLDTTAPDLTFRAHSGAEAGFWFEIGYTLDEGAVVAATFSAPGRTLTMRDRGDSLMADIPSDWPDGMATVAVTVADDVGNEATFTMQVPVSGVRPVPRPAPSFGGGGRPPPRRRRRPEHRHHTLRSRSRVRSQGTVVRERTVYSGHVASALYRADASAQRQHVILARSDHRLTGQRSSAGSVSGRTTTTISRRDDPGTEQALLTLGVL